MSKPLKIFLLAAFLSAVVPVPGLAEDYGSAYPVPPESQGTAAAKRPESYGATIGKKVGAGFSNIGLGFLEIPKNVINTTNEGNFALGITGGVLKGVLYTCGRVLVGVTDLLTFPVPSAPLTTPQFVWQKFNVETRYNSAFKMKQ